MDQPTMNSEHIRILPIDHPPEERRKELARSGGACPHNVIDRAKLTTSLPNTFLRRPIRTAATKRWQAPTELQTEMGPAEADTGKGNRSSPKQSRLTRPPTNRESERKKKQSQHPAQPLTTRERPGEKAPGLRRATLLQNICAKTIKPTMRVCIHITLLLTSFDYITYSYGKLGFGKKNHI